MAEQFSLDTVFAGRPGIDGLEARTNRLDLYGRAPALTSWATAYVFEWIVPRACRLLEWRVATLPQFLANATDYGRIRLQWTNNAGAVTTVVQLTNQTQQFAWIESTTVIAAGSVIGSVEIGAGAILRLEKLIGAGAPAAVTEIITHLTLVPV